jgi:hypothetical protein
MVRRCAKRASQEPLERRRLSALARRTEAVLAKAYEGEAFVLASLT